MIRYLKFVASIIITQAIIWTRCQSKFFDYYGDNRGGGDDGGGDPRTGSSYNSGSSSRRDVEYLANYENFEPQNYMGKKSKYNRDYRNLELPTPESEPVLFEPDFQIESPQQNNPTEEYNYYNPYRKAEQIIASPYPKADDIFSQSKTERSRFFVQDYDSYIKSINSETLTNGTYKRSPDSNSTHISENKGIQNDPKFSGEQTDEDKTTANVGQNFETLSDVQYLIKTNSPSNHNHEEIPVETSTIINKVETTSNDNRADENVATTTTKLEISSSTDTSSTSQPPSNDYDYDLTISEKSNIINSELEKVPSTSSPKANVYVDTANSIRTTTTTDSSLVVLEIDKNKITSTLTLTIKPTQSIGIYINDEETDKVDGEILTTTSASTKIPLSAEQPATTINIPLAQVEDQTSTIGYESNVTSSSSSYEDINSTLINIITKSDALIEIPISSLREDIKEQIEIPETTIMGLDETTFIPEPEEPDINTSIQMGKDTTTTDNNDNSLTTEDPSESYEEIGSESEENSTDEIVYLGLDQNTSTTIIGEQILTNRNSNRTINIDSKEIKLVEKDDQISSTLEFETNLNLFEPEITTIQPDDEFSSDRILFEIDNTTDTNSDKIDSINTFTADSVLENQSIEITTYASTFTSEESLISEDYNPNNVNVILNSETNIRENNYDPKIIQNVNNNNSSTIYMDMNINVTTITSTGKTLIGDEIIISTDSKLVDGDYLIKRNSRLDSPPEKSVSSDSDSENSSTYYIDIQANGNEAENTKEVELDKNLKSPLNPTTDISVTINADNQSSPDESSTIKEMKVDDEEAKLRWERDSTGIYTKNDTKNESQSQQLNQTHIDKTLSSEDSDGNDYSITSSKDSSKNRNNNLTIMTGNDGIELSDQNQNITINLIEGGDTNNKNNSSSSRLNFTTSKMSNFENNINDSSFRRMGGSSELLNEVKDLTSTDKDMNMNETTDTGKSRSQSSAADDRDKAEVVTKSSTIFEKIVEINESSLQDQKDKNTQAFVLKESRSIGGLKNASANNNSSMDLNETLKNIESQSQKTSEERFLEEAESEMNDFAKHLVSMDVLLKEKSVNPNNFENETDFVKMDQSLPTNDTSNIIDSSTLFDNTTEILEPLEITTNLSGKNSSIFYDSNLKTLIDDNDNETIELEGKYKNETEIKIELILENATERRISDSLVVVVDEMNEPIYSIAGPNEAMNSTLEGQVINILPEYTTIEIVTKIYSEKFVEKDLPILVNPTDTLPTSSILTFDEPEVIEKNLIKDLKSIDEIELVSVIPSNEIVKNSSSSGNINNSFNAILRDQNELGLEMNSQIGDKNALLKDKIEIILDKEFSRESDESTYSSTTDSTSANDLDQKLSSLNPSFEEKNDEILIFSESTTNEILTTFTEQTNAVIEGTDLTDFISTEGTTMAVKNQVLLIKSEMKPESKILDEMNEIDQQQAGITIRPESGSNVTPSIYTNQQPDIIPLVRIDSNLSTTSEIEGTKNQIELKPEVLVEEMGVQINTTNTTITDITNFTEIFVNEESPSSKLKELVSPLDLLKNSTIMNATTIIPEVVMKPTSYNFKNKADMKTIGRGFKGIDFHESIARNNLTKKISKPGESSFDSFIPSEENTDIYLKPSHIELRLEPEVNVMPKSLEQIDEISILEGTIEPTTTRSTSIINIFKPEESSNNNDTISDDLISSTISNSETDSSLKENVKSSIILKDPKWLDLTMVQEKKVSENALDVEGNALDNYSDFTTKSQTTDTTFSDDVLIILQTTNPTTEAESYTISSLLADHETLEKIISLSSTTSEEKPVGDELLQVVRSSNTTNIEDPRMSIDINEISFSQKDPDYVENDINKNFDDEDQKIGSVKVQEIIEKKNFPPFDNLRLSPSSFSSTLSSSNSKQLDNTITARINDDGTRDRSRKKDGPFGLTVGEKYDEIKPSYKINNNNIMKNRVKGFERIIPSGSRFSNTKTRKKTTQIYTSPSSSTTTSTTVVSPVPTTVMFENILKNDGSTTFSPNTFSSSTKTPPSSSLSLKQCLDRPIICQHCHGVPPFHICGSDLRIYQNECEFLCHWKICPVLKRVDFPVCWSKVKHHQIFQEQVPKPKITKKFQNFVKIKKPQPPSHINQHMEAALKLERFLSRWYRTIR